MNLLVVYAHPNPKSFCHAIVAEVLSAAESMGHGAELRDLYASRFDPVLAEVDFVALSHGRVSLDVAVEQQAIDRADLVLLVYPIWWYGMPAILKGWMDRVMSRGFAYDQSGGKIESLLSGKKIGLIATAGNKLSAFESAGFSLAMDKLMIEGFFGFMKMNVVLNRRFFSVPSVSEAERKAMLAAIRQDLQGLLLDS